MPLASRLVQLLRRETSSGGFLPEIDGVRFIAIFSVVLYHFWGNFEVYYAKIGVIPSAFAPLAYVIEHGGRGVPLFYVISGFILGLPFARAHLEGGRAVSLSRYYKRRVFRLEPPYILCLLLMFAVFVLAMRRAGVGESLWHLAASLLYCHNLVYGEPSTINYVAWSLEIEVQFYILAPFLSYIFAVRSVRTWRWVLLGAIFGSACMATLLGQRTLLLGQTSLLFLSLPGFLHFFLVGFFLVDLYLADWKRSPSTHYGYDALFFGALLAFYVPSWKTSQFHYGIPVSALLAGMIVFGAFRGRVARAIMRNPFIYVVGGMCYTIYLWHFPVIGLLGHGRLFVFGSFWLNLAFSMTVVLPAVLAVCAALFVMGEKPFMRRDWHLALGNRLRALRRHRPLATSVPCPPSPE
jgi:peptidoglycan/LPS O-acetylase OafA/YrhL